ncbi:non-canonical purine NTP pyrophosphatase [Gordonia sp. HY285]|nr:non-canonical purine NTP pyrophosphatase [Gordonia liuliyuniae]
MVDGAEITGLDVLGLGDVDPYPEPVEDGATFEDNALLKAREAVARTGLASLADDSGIAVDALNGMPGILSARWSGPGGQDGAGQNGAGQDGAGQDERNNDLLLAQLADVPTPRRGAAFVSVCALVLPDGSETVVRGEWRGQIVGERRGTGGFGYDPLFLPDDDIAAGRTAGELNPAEKDALSHRHKALQQLLPALAELAEA